MNLLTVLAVFVLVGFQILTPAAAKTPDGLIQIKSPHSAKETMDRFEAAAKSKGLTVFARVDHAAGAASVQKSLRPTEVLIYGNPQGGTPFMLCAQTVGIDLPLKALVWEGEDKQVWLGYNDPAWIAKRHGVASCPVVITLTKTLAGLAQAATK